MPPPGSAAPAVVRVGVTGHRWIGPDTVGASAQLQRSLSEIENGFGVGGAACRLVTALADGADRRAAIVARERGWLLEALLPLPVDDYRSDFEPSSDAEFRRLLRQCACIEVAPAIGDERVDAGPAVGVARVDAYLSAGRAMVERSDIVLALWDGQPARGRGGTAEIVSLARERSRPMIWIKVARSGDRDPGRVSAVGHEHWAWEQRWES